MMPGFTAITGATNAGKHPPTPFALSLSKGW